LNGEKENSLSLKNLQRDDQISVLFRNHLVSIGYTRFDGTEMKGPLCYEGYFKDFFTEGELSYTIYCYCYDLRGVIDDPGRFQFIFESQIESERGIIGFESVQWQFETFSKGQENLEYFEFQVESYWKIAGSKKFPS
jgi:hypothetical protein